jgi:hypothetical protein
VSIDNYLKILNKLSERGRGPANQQEKTKNGAATTARPFQQAVQKDKNVTSKIDI